MPARPKVGRLPQLERDALRFLAIYRYFSFMIAVGLMLVLPPLRGVPPALSAYLSLGVVGAYVIFRVIFPRYPRPGSPTGYASLGVDIAVALGSVLATGGLHSGLLLYSLAPVITVSLLMEDRVAYFIAGLNFLVLLVAHTVIPPFPWILREHYPVVFLLYAMANSLVAIVPFRTNLNVGRRLKREAIEEERHRLRREIHDTLAQQMGFLKLKAGQIRDSLASSSCPGLVQEMDELQATLHKSYQDIRRYLDALSLEAGFPLTTALQEIATDFTASTGISLETSLPHENAGLSPLAEVHLVRIAQEALSNIRKHSGAQKARLTLSVSHEAVELIVADDGQGFAPGVEPPAGHYGLTAMRERAQEIGADITVTSAPAQGTEVKVRLPL